jgi:DNA-binding beta-propeller fold protein YncE
MHSETCCAGKPDHTPKKLLGLGLACLLALAIFLALPVPRGQANDQRPAVNLPLQLEWVGTVRSAADVTGNPSRLKWLFRKIMGTSDSEKTLNMPYGIAIDRQGRMLVADTKGRVVHLFDPAKRKYKVLRAPDSDPFLAPIAVALDPQGNIYVSDSMRSRLFVFNAEGKFKRTIGALGKNESIFKRCTGIAIDAQRGRLYVVDTVAMNIVVLDLNGKVIQRIGHRGADAGEFNYPTQISVAQDGSLWVTDSLNFRVQHLSADGKPVSGFGRLGDGVGEFDKAKGIALDEHNNIYLVDGMRDRVQVFSPEGRLLFFFGTTGAGPGEFFLPTGITVDHSRIYVGDGYNRRVQIFQLRANAGNPGAGQ